MKVTFNKRPRLDGGLFEFNRGPSVSVERSETLEKSSGSLLRSATLFIASMLFFGGIFGLMASLAVLQ